MVFRLIFSLRLRMAWVARPSNQSRYDLGEFCRTEPEQNVDEAKRQGRSRRSRRYALDSRPSARGRGAGGRLLPQRARRQWVPVVEGGAVDGGTPESWQGGPAQQSVALRPTVRVPS